MQLFLNNKNELTLTDPNPNSSDVLLALFQSSDRAALLRKKHIQSVYMDTKSRGTWIGNKQGELTKQTTLTFDEWLKLNTDVNIIHPNEKWFKFELKGLHYYDYSIYITTYNTRDDFLLDKLSNSDNSALYIEKNVQ